MQKIIINSIMTASEHNRNKAQVWRDFIILSGKRSIEIREVAVDLKILFKQVQIEIMRGMIFLHYCLNYMEMTRRQ